MCYLGGLSKACAANFGIIAILVHFEKTLLASFDFSILNLLIYIYFQNYSQFKKAFRKTVTCSRSNRKSYQSTKSRDTPAGSYVIHQKQEQSSLNNSSVTVVTLQSDGGPMKKS